MTEMDPRLRAALQNADRETAGAVSSLRSMAASIRKEHEQFKREAEKRREQRDRDARTGELGRDVQRLQERVDRRETTWGDVLEGRDTHPSATVARQNVQRGVDALAVQVQADPDFVEEQQALRVQQERTRAEREG
jgi:hypothetical protein